jgi:hypothetical protein
MLNVGCEEVSQLRKGDLPRNLEGDARTGRGKVSQHLASYYLVLLAAALCVR